MSVGRWMKISLNTVITNTNKASQKSAWDSLSLSKTTPLTAAESEGRARNTRKTSNPLWVCLSLNNAFRYFSWKQRKKKQTQGFHCSWQGPSCPGWCWRGTSLTVITCKCIYLLWLMIATVFCQGWSKAVGVDAFIWDSSRTINFTICLCFKLDRKG